MTSPTNMNPTNYSDISAKLPEYWCDRVIMRAEREEYWADKEGPEGSKSAIIRRDGKLNQNGSKETFNTVDELMGEGVEDETELRGNEEKIDIGEFELSVGILRHAVSFTEKARRRSLIDLAKIASPLLSRWLARRKDANLDYQLLSTDTPTTLYAGDASDETELDTDCTFGWDDLEKGFFELDSMGAEPIEIEEENGQIFPVYVACISEYDFHHLKKDAMYIKAMTEAAEKGYKNPIFTRASAKTVNGCLIHVRKGIRGKLGTRLRPECQVYGAHLNNASTLVVGPNNGKSYTQYFPASGVLSVTNAAGKTEFIQYSEKTKYSFTLSSRGYTYGNTTSAASAYSGGELVTLGKHLSHQIFYGSQIAFRAFTSEAKAISQLDDYGMVKGIGIFLEFGQKAVKGPGGENKNYVIMKSNSCHPRAAEYMAA